MSNDARRQALIGDLLALSAECQWVEFKENNVDATMIGRLISALSNAARLADQPYAYVVWGVRDHDHLVVGTAFDPTQEKWSNQPLEFWLAQQLLPSTAFVFVSLEYHGQRLVLLEIPAAAGSPVAFNRVAYLRIGSATPKLIDYPEREKALWNKLQPYVWEQGCAATFLTGDDVLARLDYPKYFELTHQPLPDNRNGIFERLAADRLILPDVGGHWNITHLGAILFAKRVQDFSPSIARKAARFVAYDGGKSGSPGYSPS